MIAFPERLALKLVIGLAAALMLALLIGDRNRWKSKASHYSGLLAAERGAHSATVAGYRAAAGQARAADAANEARVKASQAAINERTANDYESRIAAARAYSDRLRRQARANADSGAGRAAPMPRLSAAAGVTAEAAGENRLSRAERLLATEQAIQLDELIRWVRRQHAVPASGGRAQGESGTGPNALVEP